MSGVNKVILIGRLGADPELRSTPSGAQVCSLSIATSDTWVKDGKREEKTEWHRVSLWGKQAEIANKYLKKGRMVYIEGRLQTRSWQDAQGQKRFSTDIIGNTLQFLESAGNSGSRDSMDNTGAMNEPQGPDSYYQTASTPPYNETQYAAPLQEHLSSIGGSISDDIPF